MTSFEKGNKIKFKKPLGHMIWFKVFLTFLVFIPPYSQILYDPLQTPNVIAAVMEKPLVAYLAWILPIAKTALLMAIILPFIFDKLLHKFLLAYYAVILLIIAIMQNISFTEDYGFVWLMGNTLVQFVVVGFCLVDLLKNKTSIKREYLVKSRLWIVFFMFLAFLMPYSVTGEGYVYPSLTANIF